MKKLKLNSRLKKLCICFLLAFVCFFGLFGVGLKVNASINSFERMVFEKQIVNGVNNYYLFQAPHSIIDVDSTIYPLVRINNRQGVDVSYLGISQTATDNFVLYYNNNVVNYEYFNTHFIAISIYENNTNNEFLMDMFILELNENGSLSLAYTIASGIVLGGNDYNRYIKIGGISLGNIYIGGSHLDPSSTISLIDAYLSPNIQSLISTTYNNGFNNGYNSGYNTGYNTGYSEGQSGENAISPVWNVLTGIFNSVGAILSIELIPHIPIGLLIFVPLFFIMVMAILSIWRKNW